MSVIEEVTITNDKSKVINKDIFKSVLDILKTNRHNILLNLNYLTKTSQAKASYLQNLSKSIFEF